jgi:hypothetical protein
MLTPGASRFDSLVGDFVFVDSEFGQAFRTGDDHKEALGCRDGFETRPYNGLF